MKPHHSDRSHVCGFPRRPYRRTSAHLIAPFVSLVLCLAPGKLRANIPLPGGGGDTNVMLDSWSFNDTTSWASDRGLAPISLTNLDVSNIGDGSALVVDSPYPAWLQYYVVQPTGPTNLTVNSGSVVFWFAPHWASTNQGGTGPGVAGRLIEAGNYTTNASYGWWSLYANAAGTSLSFGAQTNNGSQATYLSAPISWTSNYWHLVALTYSSSGSALYLDGNLVTNGSAVTYWPGTNVLANGFLIGSDFSSGLSQAHGMFDDMATYSYPIDSNEVSLIYDVQNGLFHGNPLNLANMINAPSYPTNSPNFDAIAGAGSLQDDGPASICVTNSNVWFTNVSASLQTNGTVSLTFTIAGGLNGAPYDVFANAAMGPTNAAAYGWAWMGQGYHCETYTLSGLPAFSAYLILGTPRDTDGDGLTDAYELLVSHTNPNSPDSSGDGMLDGWKVLWGLNPSINNWAQTGERSNFGYLLQGWLDSVSGVQSGTVGLDPEGNITQTTQ